MPPTDPVVAAACERLGSCKVHDVRVAVDTCREMEVAPLARQLHSMQPDRERIRRRLATIEDGRYSVVEMAADLERLATHPIWETVDQQAAEIDAMGEELARLRRGGGHDG